MRPGQGRLAGSSGYSCVCSCVSVGRIVAGEVITAGGVLGKITGVTDAYITVEVAPNTELSVQKAAVQTLLPKGTIKSIK